MKSSHVPHLDILGITSFSVQVSSFKAFGSHEVVIQAGRRSRGLRSSGCLDSASFVWSYCKLIHLAGTTLPSLVSDALQLFDVEVEVRQCFIQSIAIEATDCAWKQAQLNLSHGGLGLR